MPKCDNCDHECHCSTNGECCGGKECGCTNCGCQKEDK